MLNFKIVLFSFLFGLISFGQNTNSINTKLKLSLDSLIEKDSSSRVKIVNLLNQFSTLDPKDTAFNTSNSRILDSIQVLSTIQEKQDSLNIVFIDSIIRIYGYPGRTLVGTPTNEYAWYIIQHSSKIDNYLKTIKQAGKNGEIPMILVAKMIDRSKMQHGKKQIYGTQGSSMMNSDGNVSSFIWPTRSPKKVNKKRLKAGFGTTIEENCQILLKTEYRIVKMKEVKHLLN